MPRRKNKAEKPVNHERWLISYADFVTLLFAVFVMLYAMSKVDQQKAQEVMASMAAVFSDGAGATNNKISIMRSEDIRKIPTVSPTDINPGHGPNESKSIENIVPGRANEREFKAIKASIDHYITAHGFAEKVQVSIDQRGLVVSLKEIGFFEAGSADVKPSANELLMHVAKSLSGYNNHMRIEGHTDNLPMSSRLFESNWELSTKRATNIVHFLADRHFCNPNQLSAVGYGEFKPVADNSTVEGRARNRRVDIVMLSQRGDNGY